MVEGRNDSSVEEIDNSAEAEVEDDRLDREFQAKVIAQAVYTLDEWREKAANGRAASGKTVNEQEGPRRAGQKLKAVQGKHQGRGWALEDERAVTQNGTQLIIVPTA